MSEQLYTAWTSVKSSTNHGERAKTCKPHGTFVPSRASTGHDAPSLKASYIPEVGESSDLNTCGYNMTYVQGKVSFELAVIDALLLLEQKSTQTVLVNGLDELTPYLKIMLDRLHCVQPQKIMGEGASCFVLSKQATATSQACLIGCSSAYLPQKQTTTPWSTLLAQSNCQPEDIDLLLCGQAPTKEVHAIFSRARACSYSQLCGHYPTNAAFAMGLGIELLQANKQVQQALGDQGDFPTRLAIYNQEGQHRALIVLEKVKS